MKDTLDRWLTRALFFETASPEMRDKFDCPYTLKEDDHEVDGVLYLSLRKIYLSYNDPYEYVFATEVLGSWEHWQKIANSKTLSPHIKEWREELEIKLQSKGFAAMVAEANGEGRSKATAAKWLAEKGWSKGDLRGRPSKKSVTEEALRQERLRDETAELLEHGNRLQ